MYHKSLKTREMFMRLHPGENPERQFAEHQIRKCFAAMIIIAVSIVAAIGVFVHSRMEGRLEEEDTLRRNEWGKGSYYVTLSASTEVGSETVTLEVKERQYTEQEILAFKEEAVAQLQQVIVGNNESLMHVRENLNLVKTIKGYPFSISWRSSDHQRIKTDGTVMLEELSTQGEEIILTAVFVYEQFTWEENFKIRLLPKVVSPEQEYSDYLRKMLEQNDKLYRTSDRLYLPMQIEGLRILWEERKEENSVFILFVGFAGALLLLWGMDRDIQKRDRKRLEELIMSYPDFVSRLQLYMGAGLTAKNAFLKLGKDYRQQKSKTGKKQYLYEEILISGYQFSNGKSEGKIYQEWGQRCGEMHYRKLGFLLTNHLKQGNDKILSMLSEETENALEERRNRAKQKGEEVGTKLLFPMMLMLIVVMFLILLPAFADFRGM